MPIYIVSSYRGVIRVRPKERAERHLARWKQNGIRLEEGEKRNAALARELDAYFAGKLRQFTVPLDLRGTAFQLEVWELLCDIPYGEIRSYGEVAQAVGKPGAARAVGRAVGSNPEDAVAYPVVSLKQVLVRQPYIDLGYELKDTLTYFYQVTPSTAILER